MSPSSRSRSIRSRVPGPMQERSGWKKAGLCVCLLLLLGMVVLFGGTALWASTPFLFPLLAFFGVYQVQNFLSSRANGRSLFFPPGSFLWFAVVLYACVRAVYSPVPFDSWKVVYFLTCGWLIYFWMADLGNHRRAIPWVVSLLAFAGIGLSMWALTQHLEGTRNVLWLERPEHYRMRASGTFICPNHFAHFLQMASLCALAFVLTPKKGPWLKIVCIYGLAVMIPVLILTLSRAGWLGMIAGAGTLIWVKQMRKGWKRGVVSAVAFSLAVFLGFGLLLALYPPMATRLNERTLQDIRITQIWPDTWRMIQGEGFWGSGPGTFAAVFESYRENFSAMHQYLLYAHNDYLQFIAEYGWLVAVSVFGFILFVAGRLFRASLKTASDESAMIPLTLLTLLISTGVHALFDFNLHIPANALLFCALIGAYSGQGALRGVFRPNVLPRAVGKGLMLLTATLSFAMLVPSVSMGVGGWNAYQMRLARERRDTEAALAYAENVRRWSPARADGWVQLGEGYRNQAFWMRVPERRSELIGLSRDAYEEALSRDAINRDALVGLLELAVMENRHEEALELIKQLERLRPFDQRIQIRKGLTLRQLGRDREALEVFETLRHTHGVRTGQVEVNLRQLRQRVRDQE